MLVKTPYLPHEIEVKGSPPYHVETPGHAVIICDDRGMNRVCFEPGKGVTLLMKCPLAIALCESICNFLNNA